MSSDNAARGYVLAVADGSDFYIPNALHVERDDDLFLYADDESAAKAAERDDVQLIYGMEDVPDGVYVDTPENRIAILKGLEEFPEYRTSANLEATQSTPGCGLTL